MGIKIHKYKYKH